LLAILLCSLPLSADAVQWRAVATSTRNQVAYDEDSVRLTQLGRLTVWLRFVPRGEAQRKAAAAEYEDKRYRFHLEFFEIDCSQQNAVLGMIDLYGSSRERLKRMKGSDQLEMILPGSVLDLTALQVCPMMEDMPGEEELEAPGSDDDDDTDEANSTSKTDAQAELLMQKKLHDLKQAATENPSDPEKWRSLGNACFDADRHEEAINAYGRALKLLPEDTDMLNDQGAMYRQTRNFTKALENFEKAFKLDPRNLESLFNSAYVYAFDLNNIPKALEQWRLYLQRDNQSENARQILSFVERFQKGND
jgi:tetratricopeptide (TPR) repeat protein